MNAKLISQILTNSSKSGESIKKLSSICAQETNCTKIWDSILSNLKKSHAQIRLNALNLIDSLFQFESVRTLVYRDFEVVHHLSTQRNLMPMQFRQELYSRLPSMVSQWIQIYRYTDPRIQVLAQVFESLQKEIAVIGAEDMTSSISISSIAINSNEIRLKKYLAIIDESGKFFELVDVHITQLKNSIDLIVPNYNNCAEIDKDVASVNNYGLGTSAYTIELEIPSIQTIERHSENEIIFETVVENRRILLKSVNKLTEWLSLCGRVEDSDRSRYQNFIKKLINSKQELCSLIEKAGELLDQTNDSDEEEFFEIVDNLNPIKCAIELPAIHTSKTDLKPTIPESKISTRVGHREKWMIETDVNAELIKVAPEVKYDKDLDYWSKTSVNFSDIATNAGIDYHHRFLGDGPSDNKISLESLNALKTRVVYVEGPEPQEYKACRYPLGGGLLCSRRDMNRCPFHGPIIARNTGGVAFDDQGKIIPNEVFRKNTEHQWERLEGDVVAGLGLERPPKRRLVSTIESIAKPRITAQDRLLKLSNKISNKSLR